MNHFGRRLPDPALQEEIERQMRAIQRTEALLLMHQETARAGQFMLFRRAMGGGYHAGEVQLMQQALAQAAKQAAIALEHWEAE